MGHAVPTQNIPIGAPARCTCNAGSWRDAHASVGQMLHKHQLLSLLPLRHEPSRAEAAGCVLSQSSKATAALGHRQMRPPHDRKLSKGSKLRHQNLCQLKSPTPLPPKKEVSAMHSQGSWLSLQLFLGISVSLVSPLGSRT